MALQIPLYIGGSPFIDRRLTAGDTAHLPGDLQVDGNAQIDGNLTVDGTITGGIAGLKQTVTNDNGDAMVVGEAVYVSADDTVKKAQADDEDTSNVVGLVFDTSIADQATGSIQTTGTVTATTGEWDAVTGESGGLTAGAVYYLSTSTAGQLTQIRPVRAIPVGIAVSTTELFLYVNNLPGARPLLADHTIYVDTGGSDTTGDGTAANPYQTINRAAEDYSRLLPGNNEIHIDLGVGVHTHTSGFKVTYPFGGRLFWDGKFEDVSSPSISNIDASATTGSSPYTGLEYVDFDLDVSSASNVAVGHFVRMTSCTGGTNPEGLNGLHEIVALAAGTATCRVWRRVSTTELPSGAITVSTARIIETVLHFTGDDHGLEQAGPTDLGHWDAVVVRGNDTAVGSSKRGLRLFNGAGIRAASVSGLTTGLYVYEWAVGHEIVGQATAYILRGGIAKMTSGGVSCDLGGLGVLRNASTVNGVAGTGLRARNGSGIVADTVIMQSCAGTASFARADTGSYVNVDSATISFDQGAGGFGVVAFTGGYVEAPSVTQNGITTEYSPDPDEIGNGGAYINVNDTDYTYPHDNKELGYGSGANYILTTSPAEVDEGTDSAITLDEAGTYLISGWCELYYSGATYSTSAKVTFKLRRTNNTASDLTNGTVEHQTWEVTTFTGSTHLVIPFLAYTTSNTDDRIALFIDHATGPSAGNLQVVQSNITAIRIT